MRTRITSRLFSVVAATALTAAAFVAPNNTLFAENTMHPSAARIVAVGGSVTEVVFALGEEDRLVARDSTSIFPQEATELPDVGYIRALSPEGVMSVDPNLILMLEGSGPQETVDVLQKSGIAIVDVPEEFTAEGILEKVRAVGSALGVPKKAEVLANQLKADLDAAQGDTANVSPSLRVLFILSTRGGRIIASGVDTAADGIITLAGAENAISEFTGYKQLSDEAILSAAPDVVLMMDRRGNHGVGTRELFNHPALAQTPAGKNNKLIKMGGQYLLGFGPRTANAIRDLAAALSDVRS
jgi:iron complex transport system substrate-binding protein